MAIKLHADRPVCSTKEAANIYGCTQRHIRTMAERKEIWFRKIGERAIVVDPDQIRKLAAEKADMRRAGKLGGRRPGGRKSA